MKKYFFGLLVLLVLPFASLQAANEPTPAPTVAPLHSQPIVATAVDKRSHPETVVMAVHKLSKSEPVYEKWAPLSPTVHKAKEIDRETTTRNEMMRMKVGYDALSLTTPLVVQTKLSMNNYSTLNQVLGLPEFNSRTYFKFNMYGENVALIPKDITKFAKLQLDAAKIDTFLTKTNGNRELLGEILIRPLVADMSSPFVDEGVSYNLLMGDIAEFRLWGNGSAGPELLWFYRSDWYKPRDKSNLMDLKSGTLGQ